MTFLSKVKTGAAALVVSAATVGLLGGAVFAGHHAKAIKAAVDHPDRPAADRERDVTRKPADVLMFAGIAPGMHVFDINSAGGYYTEILSRTVGDAGKVYAHNGAVYWAFMKETVPARFDGDRLANVEHIHNGRETIEAPEGSLDAIMAVLAYHDYYFTHEARPEGHEDVAKVLASAYKALKPGGSFIVIDHKAVDGTGPADFDKMHRIDPAFVKNQMAAAGFTFAGENDLLANPGDDGTASPFAPEIRGKTNRFMLKFTK